MANHFKGPLLGSRQLFGGAGEDLAIVAAQGESELVTIFDDFNGFMPVTTFAAVPAADVTNAWEASGWILTDVGSGGTSDVGMNDPVNSSEPTSSIRINAAAVADTGGHMHLNTVAAVDNMDPAFLNAVNLRQFEHLPFRRNTNQVINFTKYIFACRVGLISATANDFDGKAFIGFSVTTEGPLLATATGDIDPATESGPVVGFHINGDPRGTRGIYGICQRTATTAYVEGTNRRTMTNATVLSANTPGSIVHWYDLAFRMTIGTVASVTANGSIEFYFRDIGALGGSATSGSGAPSAYDTGSDRKPWKSAGILTNQNPSNLNLYPSFELINGPTRLSDMLVDWWAMGVSRARR